MKPLDILLLFLGFLAGCGYTVPNIPPQAPNVVSLDPQKWYIFYSATMPPNPTADNEGAWSFQFPSAANGGHVNYVQTPFNSTTTMHTVKLTFRVESNSPQYVVLDPGDHPPATVRIFFEQIGDDLTNPDGRWWAQSSMYNLGLQDNTILSYTIPFTPDMWTNVNGQQNAQAFNDALKNIGWVGVTCGGQYFAGHGVALNGGTAKYILIDFQVN